MTNPNTTRSLSELLGEKRLYVTACQRVQRPAELNQSNRNDAPVYWQTLPEILNTAIPHFWNLIPQIGCHLIKQWFAARSKRWLMARTATQCLPALWYAANSIRCRHERHALYFTVLLALKDPSIPLRREKMIKLAVEVGWLVGALSPVSY